MSLYTPMPSEVEYAANLASILTAVVAATAWGGYVWSARGKRKKLESYLRKEKENKPNGREDRGQRSLLHLMARVGLAESEHLWVPLQVPLHYAPLATARPATLRLTSCSSTTRQEIQIRVISDLTHNYFRK